MKIEAKSPEEYISKLPEERKEVFGKLRQTIIENMTEDLREEMSYGMIGYVIPHEVYPDGYHCNPKLPLPFINIGNQKNYIALYHSGIYSSSKLMDWWVKEYTLKNIGKLDMGKSCIRFKKMDKIPFDLIAQLVQKMSAQDYIKLYESVVKN